MKKTTLFFAALLSFSGLFAKRTTPAEALIKRLKKIQKAGTMIGHQDAFFYGTTWKWQFGRSDMQDVCGDAPAVLGCELGGLELGADKNIDGVPFDRMKEQIVRHATQGGVVTLSWHPANPANGGNAWNVEGDAVKKVLPNGTEHAKMQLWLERMAQFIGSLQTKGGKPIAVIFRPWHEMSGSWFWWGAKHCTTEEYKQLFRMTVEKFRQLGLTNVVWSYSPGADGNDTPEHFFSFYPGDAYVDMLGVDLYQYSGSEEFIRQGQLEMKIMHDYAKPRGMLYALTETGYRNTPDPQWFTGTLRKAFAGYRPSYVLLWRNAWDNPEENFGPAPEKMCADDFRKFAKDILLLFLNGVRGKK